MELAVWILFLVAIVLGPLWLTTWRVRRVLRRSLGREIRDGEETSLNSWMRLSGEQLDAGGKELERDLVVRLAGVLEGPESDPLGEGWGEAGQSGAERAEPASLVCPRDSTPLTAQLVGPPRSYGCSTCHGLWVSGTALRSFLASAEVSLDLPSLKIPATSQTALQSQPYADAPRCLCNGTTVMERKVRLGVQIDDCPDCRGIWLDGGELLGLANGIPRPRPLSEAFWAVLQSGGRRGLPGLFGGGRSGGGGGGARW